MQIYLLRHAIAARGSGAREADGDRPLTRRGREKMAVASRGMRNLGLGFDCVLSSPLLRARQTARIVTAAMRPRPPVEREPALSPGGEPAEMVKRISMSGGERLLLVGHEPALSRLAAHLLLGGATDLPLEFRKGGLCRIDFEGEARAGGGRLVYHLTPKILRALAG